MQVVLAVSAIIVAIFNPVSAVDADCNREDAQNSFADSFYDAIVKDSDPDDINNLEIEGSKASVQYYKELKKYLDDHKQCNSDEIAFTAARAVAQVQTLTLQNYLKKSAATVGRSLFEFGVLDCSNAIALSLEYEGYVQNQKNSAAEDCKFGSYIHGIIYGWFNLISAHGLKLEDVTQEAADFFYQSFREGQQEECSTSQPSVPDDAKDAGDADCNRSDAEKSFADTLYNAVIASASDPDLEADGGEVGIIKYNEAKKSLEDHQVCNADGIAFTTGRLLAQSQRVTLKNFLLSVSDTAAEVLSKFGVLNCDNAVDLSNQYNNYIQQEKSGMDDGDFGSFIHGVDFGYADFLLANGVNLNNVMQYSVDKFRQSLSNKKTECKFNSTSGDDNNI